MFHLAVMVDGLEVPWPKRCGKIAAAQEANMSNQIYDDLDELPHAGLRVLREQKVPSSVVLRVLIMGGPRRGFTWARLAPSSRGALRM